MFLDEAVHDHLRDAGIEVHAPEERVAPSCEHLEHRAIHFEQTHVEGPAAEVVDHDLARLEPLAESVFEGRRRRFGEHALHVKARELAGDADRLPLAFVEERRAGNDRSVDDGVELKLGRGSDLFEQMGGDFFERYDLVLEQDRGFAQVSLHDVVREVLADHVDDGRVKRTPNQALGAEYGMFGVERGAFKGWPSHDQGSIEVEADRRRNGGSAPTRGEHMRSAVFDERGAAVRGAEVDSQDHGAFGRQLDLAAQLARDLGSLLGGAAHARDHRGRHRNASVEPGLGDEVGGNRRQLAQGNRGRHRRELHGGRCAFVAHQEGQGVVLWRFEIDVRKFDLLDWKLGFDQGFERRATVADGIGPGSLEGICFRLVALTLGRSEARKGPGVGTTVIHGASP